MTDRTTTLQGVKPDTGVDVACSDLPLWRACLVSDVHSCAEMGIFDMRF